MDVSICVATFGDVGWRELAFTRALPSAWATGVPVIYQHGTSLHEARNAALAEVRTPFVVFLDADDELAPGYIDALAAGSADVRGPRVQYVFNGRPRMPRMPRVPGHDHACHGDCLPAGNWLVIGSMARADLLRDVGGFGPEPIYEDWSLWLRCWKAGATFEAIPGAVYIAHGHAASRNRAPDRAFKERMHREIAAAILGDPQEAA